VHRLDGESGAWVGTFDATIADCGGWYAGTATPGGLWVSGSAPREGADPAIPEWDWCGAWFPWDGGAPSVSRSAVGVGERLTYRAWPFAMGDDLWFVAGTSSVEEGPSVSRDPDLYHVRPGADPTLIPGVQTAGPGGSTTVWATAQADDRVELVTIDPATDEVRESAPVGIALEGVQGGADHVALMGGVEATSLQLLDGTSGEPVATLGIPPGDDRLWLRHLDLTADSIFAMSSSVRGSSIWAAPVLDGAALEQVYACDDCLAVPLGVHGDGVWYEFRSAKDLVNATPTMVRFEASTRAMTTSLDQDPRAPDGWTASDSGH
jgi:hypothetical protein